jgi:predicted ATPase
MMLRVKQIYLNPSMERNPDEYPFDIPVINNFQSIEFKEAVTFIVGENGTGKSTLLEAIAVCCGFNPEGGSKNFNFSTKASHSSLHNYLRVVRSSNREKDGYFLRAESFYNVATEIDRLDGDGGGGGLIRDSYGGKSLHVQSHGESFWSLLKYRLSGNGLYIFDEPEAALSPIRTLSMLKRIDELVKLNSQFIISTHSPILMAYPRAEIYEIRNGNLCLTEWEESEHVAVTKYFMQNPSRMMKELEIQTINV